MKYSFMIMMLLIATLSVQAQTYPQPEFSNEVSFLSKGSSHKIVRLEKTSSKQETDVKAAGFGGMENGYSIDGLRSPVRLPAGPNQSFIFSTSESASGNSSPADSMMRASGMDPSAMRNPMGTGDPTQTISLYKAMPVKNIRKVILIKAGGMMSMGKKGKTSDKYTFSSKKIRDGYWELLIDKQLPKGEYAFVVSSSMGYSMDGSVLLFAFAID